MTLKKIGFFAMIMAVAGAAFIDANAAVTKKSQSAIQNGTTVRTRVAATGLYDQECYDAYYGCMDQFCIPENSNGGSCACSDKSIEYEKEYAKIQEMLDEADRIKIVEVGKVKAGADADIIYNGSRQYDENGNRLKVDELSAADKKKKEQEEMKALFNMSFDDDDDMWGSDGDISSKTGAELFSAAEELCLDQIPDKCDKDIQFLRQVYSRQISSDCKAFENQLATQRKDAEKAVAKAENAVIEARAETMSKFNKYSTPGECTIAFTDCMQEDVACGPNWENCVSTVASTNMQKTTAPSYAGTREILVDTYDISEPTMDVLSAKRPLCERILNECVNVSEHVWPLFLQNIAKDLKKAESKEESRMRQSCLTDIPNCIQTACKEDIAGKGKATMDACLAYPDMARSFCKVEIERCERMDPLIWTFVEEKLASMRVDACTQEVYDCFTEDTRCGENFKNCIGMDFAYLHQMCPVDKLVVCKQGRKNFSMEDIDSMLRGFYMNIDNALMDQCQKLAEDKMMEICGSTTDCNQLTADDVIGTGSLRSQKNGTTYRITGMISFGSIKVGDVAGTVMDHGQILAPGQVGVHDYIEEVRARNSKIANSEGIIASIEEELNNIAGTINRVIQMIEADPEIQYCINGRNLKNINGSKKKSNVTEARFPNLLNPYKTQIAIIALSQAQSNYDKKYKEEVAKAAADTEIDVAQYLCNKIAITGENNAGGVDASTPLVVPYAISYDVGSGLTTADLTKGGGTGVFKGPVGYMGSSVTQTVTTSFSRETRICHVCRTITSQSCSKGRSSWFHTSSKKCEVETKDPFCEDLQM